jgi:hypothetical protein
VLGFDLRLRERDPEVGEDGLQAVTRGLLLFEIHARIFPVSRVVTLKNAGVEFEDMGKRLRSAAIKGLRSAALRGVAIIVSEIIPSRVPQPVDRGIYRAGWKAMPLGGKNPGAVIYNLEPHAALIEYSVRAANVKVGRAMIAALAEWARRKGFEDPERAAWGIAKKMKERGIFGQTGLGVLRELNKRLPAIVREEVTREVEAAKARRDRGAPEGW